jgi:predicted type IV restriction endonuclease
MPDPEELIMNVQEKVLHFEASQLSLSEAETKRALVDDIFAAIGWDMSDPFSVRREWRKYPDDNPMDYAFMVNGVPRLLVEAKKLKENMDDKKWRDQMLFYSSQSGVKWCALTNGDIIRAYNSLAAEAAADKLLFEIEIKTIDTLAGLPIDAFMEKLSLLSEDSLREEKIDGVWDSVYTIRKVFDYLRINKEDIVDDIVKSAKLTEKSVSKVLDQIMKLRESFLEEKQEVPADVAPPDYTPLFDSAGKPVNYKGRRISSFWFKGSIHEVGSWRELLVRLCSIVNAEHRDEFDRILKLRETRRPYYTCNGSQLTTPKRIPNTDIFVETNLSSFSIANLCGHLLDRFGYRRDDMKVRIREV